MSEHTRQAKFVTHESKFVITNRMKKCTNCPDQLVFLYITLHEDYHRYGQSKQFPSTEALPPIIALPEVLVWLQVFKLHGGRWMTYSMKTERHVDGTG